MPDFSTSFCVFFVVACVALNGVGKVLRRFDNDGAIAGAAKGGIVNMIGRLFK